MLRSGRGSLFIFHLIALDPIDENSFYLFPPFPLLPLSLDSFFHSNFSFLCFVFFATLPAFTLLLAFFFPSQREHFTRIQLFDGSKMPQIGDKMKLTGRLNGWMRLLNAKITIRCARMKSRNCLISAKLNIYAERRCLCLADDRVIF